VKIFFLLMTTSLFGLSMQEAEERALQASPAVMLGDLQAQQNDAQYAQAFLSWFPDITFGSMVAVLQKPQKISHFQKQKHLFSNQFTLTQPIFSSELLENFRLGRLVKEGGLIGKQIAASDTLLAVRSNYLLLGVRSQELSLEHVKLAYLQKVFQDEETRLRSGRTTALQVAKAKAAISYEISKQLESQKEVLQARRQLSLLLRMAPTEEAGLVFGGFPSIEEYPLLMEKQQKLQQYLMRNILTNSPLQLSLFQEEEIQQLIREALANRPELKKSSLYLRVAETKTAQARTRYLPEVSAFVDYGYYEPVNGQFFRQRNDWAGGIQLSWSLFDSLKREMKSKEVVALRKAASLGLGYESEKLEAAIRYDVQAIEEALFVYQNAQENLFLAQQTFEESEVQFSTGGLSDLQLQDAKQFLAESDYRQTQALAALLQKYYQLQHDLGILNPGF
jgi:outer membrane protein TolC